MKHETPCLIMPFPAKSWEGRKGEAGGDVEGEGCRSCQKKKKGKRKKKQIRHNTPLSSARARGILFSGAIVYIA